MALHVFNTLTRRKDLFTPAHPQVVRIYSCGLTVYSTMHIGHARTYCFWDFFRRYLEYLGYHVISAINYTDIDDRIMGVADSSVGPIDQAEKIIATFRRDCRLLRIKDYAVYTRATDFIAGQIDMVRQLIDKGHAYVVDGEVFYDVASFTGYGKLSGKRVDELETGASGRVGEDFARKRHPADFTLWKPSSPGQPSWETGQEQWPQGRPGWHIECSTMSSAIHGCHFDVHGGAVDNLFPHHENEIAQSEPLCGSPWVRYWMHPEHLDLRGEKMSKSLGNVIGVPALLEKHRYDEVRWFYAMNHYRTKLAFSDELIDAAAEGYGKITKLLRILEEKLSAAPDVERGIPAAGLYMSQRDGEQAIPRLRHYYEYGRFGELSARFMARFREALDDDLNSPLATAALFDYVSELYSAGIESLPVAAGVAPVVAAGVTPAVQLEATERSPSSVAAIHGSPSGQEVGPRQGSAPATEGEASLAPTDDSTASLLAVYRCLARHLYVLGIEHPHEQLYPQLAVDCFADGGDAQSALAPYQAFIDKLLEARLAARKAKDFARADLLRDLLAEAGLVVEDTPAGPRWELK